MKKQSNTFATIFAVLGILALYAALNTIHFFRQTYTDVIVLETFTKKKPQIDKNTGGGDRFMVFVMLPDSTTAEFKNVDAKFSIDFKWNSGKLQSKLALAKDSKKKCTITVYGFRFAFLSWYPNVAKVTLPGEKKR